MCLCVNTSELSLVLSLEPQTSTCQVSYVGDAVPLSKINGKMREILIPGILYDVSRQQIVMRIFLQRKKYGIFLKKQNCFFFSCCCFNVTTTKAEVSFWK